MKTRLLILSVALVAAVWSFPAGTSSSPDDIAFPVPELGGCASYEECRAWCDDPANAEACQEFAERHGLAPARPDLEFPIAELGGCASEDDCRAWCDDPANAEACLDYAEAHGLMPPEEVDRARRVVPLLAAGETPGGCRTESECRAYCEDASRFEECVTFAERAGVISTEEAERARATGGVGPGGCRSGAECRAYCAARENAERCVEFAVEHGFMDAAHAETVLKFLRGEIEGPGGCDSPDACHAYCEDDAHAQECMEFMRQMGHPHVERESASEWREPPSCATSEECATRCGADGSACAPPPPEDPNREVGDHGCADASACPPPEHEPGWTPPACAERGLAGESCREWCASSWQECHAREP